MWGDSYCFPNTCLLHSLVFRNNLKFKAISLNVRGIRAFEKRKSIFNWLINQNADICFLQETYSTADVVNQWKKQWPGEVFFSHGSNHSRGVAIFVRKSLDFKVKSSRVDVEGRYLILEATIQDEPFLLINIYAPNKSAKQSSFFQALSELISDEEYQATNYKILAGGDFNVGLKLTLDCSGGNLTVKDSVKFVEDLVKGIQNIFSIWKTAIKRKVALGNYLFQMEFKRPQMLMSY